MRPEGTPPKIGPRGRVTIPVALQRAAGRTEGAEVGIRVVGPGGFTIEFVQAVKDRIRAAAPKAPAGAPYDAVAEIRADRDNEDGTGAERKAGAVYEAARLHTDREQAGPARDHPIPVLTC
ncbi:hypothetical protein SAMN05414137_120193 [Streptacidiphilus jiangxiensis]|uniref:Uncharacterized protein n=1 Tax=Streptacidiphilus jiangxiensis TaxID=235985 RepID=A0A1H7WIH2_STRJI|nr:hypothetical protein SAMN05414137_120193 [Streptacidiphilus jiangxiensis]